MLKYMVLTGLNLQRGETEGAGVGKVAILDKKTTQVFLQQ
jgi:hypothetical protein